MYMFDLNRPPIFCMIDGRFRSNMYIAVYHTNRRPIKNTIDVVKNRLVFRGHETCTYDEHNISENIYLISVNLSRSVDRKHL